MLRMKRKAETRKLQADECQEQLKKLKTMSKKSPASNNGKDEEKKADEPGLKIVCVPENMANDFTIVYKGQEYGANLGLLAAFTDFFRRDTTTQGWDSKEACKIEQDLGTIDQMTSFLWAAHRPFSAAAGCQSPDEALAWFAMAKYFGHTEMLNVIPMTLEDIGVVEHWGSFEQRLELAGKIATTGGKPTVGYIRLLLDLADSGSQDPDDISAAMAKNPRLAQDIMATAWEGLCSTENGFRGCGWDWQREDDIDLRVQNIQKTIQMLRNANH